MPDPTRFVGKLIDCVLSSGRTDVNPETASKNGILEGYHAPLNLTVKGPVPHSPATAWNMTFLEYIEGGITVGPATGAIMTGPMSGCWLFLATLGNKRILAHLGTDHSPQSTASKRVKATWKQMMDSEGQQANALGCDPFNQMGGQQKFTDLIIRNGGDLFKSRVYTYFENNSAWSIIATKQGPSSMLIEEAKPMQLMPWAQAKYTPKFA